MGREIKVPLLKTNLLKISINDEVNWSLLTYSKKRSVRSLKEKLVSARGIRNSENMKTRICQRDLKQFGLKILTTFLLLLFFITKCDASQGKQHFSYLIILKFFPRQNTVVRSETENLFEISSVSKWNKQTFLALSCIWLDWQYE